MTDYNYDTPFKKAMYFLLIVCILGIIYVSLVTITQYYQEQESIEDPRFKNYAELTSDNSLRVYNSSNPFYDFESLEYLSNIHYEKQIELFAYLTGSEIIENNKSHFKLMYDSKCLIISKEEVISEECASIILPMAEPGFRDKVDIDSLPKSRCSIFVDGKRIVDCNISNIEDLHGHPTARQEDADGG